MQPLVHSGFSMSSLRDTLTLRFALALAVLVLLVLLVDWYLGLALSPLFHSPAIDEAVHWSWAQSLARGAGSPELPYFRAPLYPWLLGALTRLGLGLAELRLVGCLLVLGGTGLLIHWARRLGGPRAGVALAFLALLDAGLVYYAPMLLIPALLVPLGIGSGLALGRVAASGRPTAWALLAGLLLGLAAIARPTALVALLPGLALLWYGGKNLGPVNRGRRLAGFLAGVLVPVALVAGFNGWPASGVLIASQGGVNFWIGNNGQADGTSAVLPGVGQAWEREDARALAADRGAQGPAAESAFYYEEGRRWLLEHPQEAAALWLRKASLVLERHPLGNNTAILAMAERSPSLHWLLQWGWAALLFLGFGGLLEGHPHNRPLRFWLLAVVLLEMLAVVAFFVNTRFLLPASALLLLPAALWLGDLAGRGRLVIQRNPALALSALAFASLAFTAQPAVAGLLAGGLMGYLPRRESTDRALPPGMLLAVALGLALTVSLALWFGPYTFPWVLAALCLPGWARLLWPVRGFAHPRLLGLGLLALFLLEGNPWGQRHTAEQDSHDRSRMHFQEGNAWLRLQQPDSAQASFLASLKAWPGQPEVRLNLGLLAEARQRPAEAETWYRVELQHDPSSAKAHNNLGNLALLQGRLDLAITAYETALQLRPGLVDASWNLGLALCRQSLSRLDQGDSTTARTLHTRALATDYTGPSLETLNQRLP